MIRTTQIKTPRKECLNCTNEIRVEGDAFCIACDDNYFLCSNCGLVDSIDGRTDKVNWECAQCLETK